MPKNPKTEQANGSSQNGDAAASTTTEPAASKKRAKSAKTASKKAAPKKTSAKSAARKTAALRPARKSKSYEPTDEEIRTRAYFLAERRVQMSLQGDPAQDWLDARQQLLDESAQDRPKD